MSKQKKEKCTGKKHHYMPQFLQKNFAIDDKFKKVRAYCKYENCEPKFNIVSIEYNMYLCDMYGTQQNYEKELADIESNASNEIRNMINNPDKYVREHEKLPESVLKFLVVMNRRNLKAQEFAKQINEAYQEFQNKHANRTPEQQKEWDDSVAELSDSNQYFGYIVNDIDQDLGHEPYDGEYTILTSKETLFLPDNIYPGLLPLTPHMLLIYSHVPHIKRISRQKSNVYIFKYANFRALEVMTNRIIVGIDTTEKYIKQLPIQFRNQEPAPKHSTVQFVLKNTDSKD